MATSSTRASSRCDVTAMAVTKPTQGATGPDPNEATGNSGYILNPGQHQDMLVVSNPL